MAANIPQMGPNGQMMMLPQQHHPQPPQQNKQLNQLVYSSLMQTMHLAPMNSWQSSVSIQDRFAKAINLYDSIFSILMLDATPPLPVLSLPLRKR
jgi:hypothetical protein